jgi:hypothetical protein
VGVDAENTAASVPLIVSLDADLRRYTVAGGERRVVGRLARKRWFVERRLGIRGGGRFNYRRRAGAGCHWR